jgi:diacylglycerol kinase family enzyme
MPDDPLQLANLTVSGPIRSVDVGELTCLSPNGTCEPEGLDVDDEPRRNCGFMVMAGAGFDAKIMEAARQYKQTVGWGAYLVGALQNLIPGKSQFNLTLDGVEHERDGIAVLVANSARLKFDLSFSANSNPADGLFEVIIVHTRNAMELLPAVWTTLATRAIGESRGKTPGLEIMQATDVIIEAEPDLPVQYDGEVIQSMTPLEARVLPGAGTLVVSEAFVDEWGLSSA